MCDESSSLYYSATQIWSHYDDDISTNSMSVDFFTYQSNNQSKLQVPKIKFSIYSKSSSVSSINFTNSELYKYIYSLKKKIFEPLNKLIGQIQKDKKFSEGFVHKTHKNNVYTTIMYNSLLDSACIRFMIGEKERALLDTDKIYIPLVEFNSLYLTLNNCFNNFPLMSQNVTMMDMIKRNSEECHDKLDEISCKINEFNISRVKPEFNISECITSTGDMPKIDADNIDLSNIDLESDHDSISEIKNNSSSQNDFDSFLESNVDSFELDLPENDKNTQKEIVIENVFQKKILSNDFSNLKLIIGGCVNSKLPLNSFVDTVYDKTGFDLYDGISDHDKYSLNYTILRNLKFNIGNFVSKQTEFPKSIVPIIVENTSNNENIIQFRVDCMYFLLLSYIYVNRVKNVLSEKSKDQILNCSYLAYALKTITTPFVFSQLMKINKDVIISSVVKLYYDLKSDGFFKSYESEILKEFGTTFNLDSKYIESEICKIYDNVIKFKDKLSIDKFYQPKIMKLGNKDFDDLVFDIDIISKISTIENVYWNGDIKKMNCIVTDGIPVKILNKYGIKESKFDNSILVKYIKSVNSNFVDLEKIKSINVNVYDILDQIDIRSYPENVLKALYFWDITKLPKNITLSDFVNQINGSNLSSNELISLILDKQHNVTDDTFYQSMVLLNG